MLPKPTYSMIKGQSIWKKRWHWMEKGWRYGKLLAQEYLAQGHLQEALMIATKYHQDYPANDGVAFLLAKCMIENKYEAAYTLLMSKTFLPNEGSTEGAVFVSRSDADAASDTGYVQK
ncbi:MAG: tetratricopeptide repeat protein [Saprospiraceae bacterium]|nr:tetratricopeptide repeat protein [Saprospiraceae bacterium]